MTYNIGALRYSPDRLYLFPYMERREKFWTIAYLSRRTGIPENTLSAMEYGLHEPTEDERELITKAFQGDDEWTSPTDDGPEYRKKLLKRWTFEKGKRYEIGSWKATYMRDEGRHHIFRMAGGSLLCFTDAQLVGYVHAVNQWQLKEI